MQSDILHVVEIIRRIPDCATQPFLCRCDNGELYVVKGMQCVPKKQLIAEWISAFLAKEMDLSIPEFGVVYVDQALTEFKPEWRTALQEGYAFATRYVTGAAPITFTQAHSNVDVQDQKKIYLLDKWINNSDRSLSPLGGNVNIIFDYQNNRYYLIDHNLAFDHDELEGEFDYHVYGNRHRSWKFDLVDRQLCEDQIKRVTALLPAVVSCIPQDWELEEIVQHTEFLEFIEETLNRAENEGFWSKIT
ncbi:HipA family kinase [Erwinia pyrifoliae]|uniref:HipA family kinase n=1 Tax=Erwinia pyrifoliae TaxID=79967 RepID=UPI0001960A7D|nr:HipA family kinase [Erwinia pyrifoliae]AUX73163.1 hypothetical protein CPI84_12105 [Erwinia pyrifoliae]MCA8876555.1 hypothetical protein [Erwinia pyrifoliae]MCT2386669.1 hypothetical protein [Erwinia pyrifoliae]MCU8587733.1 hypothetical protein [Erwinia pyrifoliae]UWS31530.1 hypothetical protein NYP81_08885 [Erwinia pyrifoliae]